MDEQTRKRIFEPFFTTKGVGKGTGLGLASAYGTMKTHRGAIRVYSEPGRGSTFHLFLPLLESSDAAAQIAEAPAVPQPGRGRILVVDDEATLLNLIRELLVELGYQVTICADPVQALELYRRDWHLFDLVILDMVMPRLSGRDLFLAMREINPQVRVLLSSGYSLNHEVQSILDAGALAFLQKPFNQAELSRKLSEALRT
jgi:CheY-like chemotaxis protein